MQPPPAGLPGLPPGRLRHDRRVLLMALAAGLPAVLSCLVLLWIGGYAPKVQWTVGLLVVLTYLGFCFALRDRVVFPLQTLSNLLAGLREGDFSIRARSSASDDPLNEVMVEVNALVDTLRHQRLGAMEATALLKKVITVTDVAIFAFDDRQRLRLVNRAGERLLGQPREQLLQRSAAELDLEPYLDERAPRVKNIAFPGASGRWEIRRQSFRQDGRPHVLLVLADVSQPLREEERRAWQRLIRVLSHELNNSMAPIQSIAGSLGALIERPDPPPDWRADAREGLQVIASRAEALTRFMASYARLARLPEPSRRPLDLGVVVERVGRLEQRLTVEIDPGPELTLEADEDQLEQLLINLIRNAVDAVSESGGGVRVGWRHGRTPPDSVELWVDDDGPGLPNTTNLFVPFFTTKPNGSGIGLPLCRQIAEAHGGSLSLENRTGGRGCRALLRLPVARAEHRHPARHDLAV